MLKNNVHPNIEAVLTENIDERQVYYTTFFIYLILFAIIYRLTLHFITKKRNE